MNIISEHNKNMPSIFFCDEEIFHSIPLAHDVYVLADVFFVVDQIPTQNGYEKGTRERKLCCEGCAGIKKGLILYLI